MKRLTTIVLLLILAANTVWGQQSVNINLTVPDTLGGCMPNRFTAKVKSPGAIFTITQQLLMGTNVASCNDIGLYVITDSVQGNVTNINYDTLTKKWSANIVDTDTVTIYYRVAISCSNIPQNSDSINNIKLRQIFEDTLGGFTYTINPLSTSNQITQNLSLPLIIDRSPATWQSSYGDEVDIYYYYYNGGSANARIRFTFLDDPSHYCGVLQQQSLMYRNGNTNYVSYVSGDTAGIILKANDTLVFRSQNIVATCLTQCNKYVQFSWSCDTAPPATDYFCKSCKVSTDSTSYSVQLTNQPNVGYTRVLPDTLPDMSCMNDSVHWRYVVTNTGIGALDTLSITLKALLAYTFQNLSLIDTSTFEVRAINCNKCNLKVNKLINQNNLCSTVVPVSLQQAVIQTDDFGKTDTLVIDFTTYRCVQDTPVLLNTGKYYDRWEFETKAGVCGISKQVNLSITNNPLLPDADIDQQLIFVPLVSDLSVPPGMNTIWGDSTTMEIEMKGLMGDDYDYTLLHCPSGATGCIADGWIRATVHCEQNLTVPTLATGLRLRWLNPATNQYVYKTPDFYHTPNDSGLCIASDYYYYFDLSDTLMRLMLDSGVCEFTLRACCNADIGRTPYSVTFHLLADPSGNCNNLSMTNGIAQCTGAGCTWLPLSAKGGSIAVHCPGCKHTGPISFRYLMERTSLGLEDTDNNGIADTSAQVIDPAGQWYQTYGNRLRLNVSSYGDQLRDRLVAHTQEGDPTNGGYDMNMLNQKGAYLKYMQVSRNIPSAFDTMKLTVTGFTLYIDKPNSTQTSCINCSDFNVGVNYRTQHIISVSGNNMYHFLDTIINHNSFLFTFSAYDSAGAVYGNLFDYNYMNSYYTDTIDTLKNFFEGQRYRLEVTYRECGSFEAPNSINLSVDDYLHQKLISNNLWLSGKKQSYDAFDMNLSAPRDTLDVKAHGWTFNANDLTLMQINQQFADSFIFMCENFSGYHYVFSQEGYNSTSITSDTSCRRQVKLTALMQSAGGKTDFYPYEYRLPAYEPESYTVKIPQGYHTVSGSGRMSYLSFTGIHSQTPQYRPWIPVSIPSGGGSIIIQDNNTGQAVCWNEDKYPAPQNDNSQYVGGYKIYKYIIFDIEPDDCPLDSVNFYADSVNIAFEASDYGCYPATACDTVFIKNMQQNYLFPARPNLSALLNPANVTATGHHVCMNLDFQNSKTSGISYAGASHVFVVIPAAPYLSNWSYAINSGAMQPVINGVVPVVSNLLLDSAVNVQLCADYDSCITDTVKTFMLQYGWNCDGFPASNMQVPDSVCYADSIEATFKPEHEQLSYSFKEHDSTYALCRNFEVSMTVNNAGLGAVYPLQVFIDSLVSSLQVQSVIISNCSTQASDTLMVSGINTWNITGANMAAIGFADSSLAAECMLVRVILNPTCAYRNVNILPNLIVIMQNLCNDTIVQTASRIHNFTGQSAGDTIVWNGQSDCMDCFTLTKTASVGSTAIGDTITFNIQVCSHNATADTVVIQELLPSAFTMTASSVGFPYTNTNFPADTCLNYSVSGYYTAVGSCPDSTFTNHATLLTTTVNYLDSVCVEVVSPCANTDTTFADSTTFAGTATLGAMSIYVAGQYFVSGTLTLNNCMVYVGAGGQITVQGGGNLILNNTTIQSCDTMWRGVTVLANGVATLNGSTIRDAENGILLQDGGVVKSANSYFYDNIIGINAQPELTLTDVYGQAQLYVTGTVFAPLSGFKKDYQQQNAHGTVPLSGIWLNKMYCTIGDSLMQENDFSKMVYGIYSQNSNLTLTNSRFTNIHNHSSWVAKAKGTAVVSWGNKLNSLSSLTMRPVAGTGSTVTQCDRGIYATWSGNDVSKVEMSQVLTGIYSANGKGRKGIYNANSIYAVKYGIWLARNEGAKTNMVTENNIYMQGSSKGIAILLDEWNNAMSAQYMITGNLIELRSAAAGIVSSYALHPNIHYNNIYQYATGSSLPHSTGISLQGSDTAAVSCNYIISDYPADSNFVSIGIEVAQSKQFTLNCNIIKYENCGVYMGGDCQMKNIYRSNQVDSCDMGLYLNTAAIIGQQFHKGNRWLNVLNKVNATNVGNPQLSQIVVHTNVNTIWHPLNISPNGPWFFPKSGTPEQCGTDCYAAFTSGEDTLLLHNIARGDSLSTGFVDETKNIAQQNLYDLLDVNDTLRYSDSVLTNFYDNNQTSTPGKFNTVKDYIKAASSVSNYFSELLHLNDSLMVQTKDSISLADSLLYTDSLLYAGIKEQLLVQLNTLMINEKTLQEQIEAIQQGEWNNSKIENSNIQPLWPPEVNRKKMNELIALVMETGEDSVQNYSSDLYSIAMQCPYSGGVSVYQARNMLRFINDSMEYDDGIACLQQGIYRMGKTLGTVENYNAIDFDLIPNPADGKTEVRILTPVDGLTKLTLRTMLGQIMEEWKLDGQQQYTIFTNKYLQGVYMIELKNENGTGRFKKLIIAR